MKGTVIDSIKVGKWKYYKPNGKKLATGRYKNNKKTGLWIYKDYASFIRIRNWTYLENCSETIEFVDNKLTIFDRSGCDHCGTTYKNGKWLSHVQM